MHEQVIILVAALNRIMKDIPPDEVGTFRDSLLRYAEENESLLCSEINRTGVLTPEMRRAIEGFSQKYLELYNAQKQGR